MAQHYIFDFFGTLCTNNKGGPYANVLSRLFPNIHYKEIEAITNKDKTRTKKGCIKNIEKKYKIKVSEKKRREIIKKTREWAKNQVVSEETKNTLLQLKKRGAKLGLISNMGLFIEDSFTNADIKGLFDATVFSHKTGFAKPEKELYKKCLTKLKVDPKSVIMVGDNLQKDVLTPIGLGMKGVLIDDKRKHPAYKNRITNIKQILTHKYKGA